MKRLIAGPLKFAAACALLLALSAASSGCMTYVSQTRFWDPEAGKDFFSGFPRVYQDIYKESLYNPIFIYGGTRTICEWFDPDYGAATITLFILDFPFCFCFDTVLLPLTITEEIWEQFYPSTEDRPESRKPEASQMKNRSR